MRFEFALGYALLALSLGGFAYYLISGLRREERQRAVVSLDARRLQRRVETARHQSDADLAHHARKARP